MNKQLTVNKQLNSGPNINKYVAELSMKSKQTAGCKQTAEFRTKCKQTAELSMKSKQIANCKQTAEFRSKCKQTDELLDKL